MTELNKLLSTEYQLDINGISNSKISYGRVPWTQSDCSFLNSHEWVETTIQIAGSKRGDTFESAKHITNHIIRYYRDPFLAACETQQVPVSKPMSATQFQAMLNAGGVGGTGERELKMHLSAHLGKGFCFTRRCVNMLSEGPCKVYYGSIKFTCKSIMEVSNLPMMEKRRQRLLSEPRRKSTMKSQSNYSSI